MAQITDFILAGNYADLPTDNAAGTTGRLYFALDTGSIHRDNGSTWDNGLAALLTALAASLAGKQAGDSDLTAIAGLTHSNDDIIQAKGGAWTNRTVAQFVADLIAAASFTEGVQDIIGAMIAAAGGSYNDGANTIDLGILYQLNIKEIDGGPDDSFTTLEFPNGTLTDEGGGTVRYTPTGGGGGGGGSFVGAHAYTNSSPTIADSTLTAVPLELEQYDTDGMHDNSTNNTRLTVQTAGKYRISGYLQFNRPSANSSDNIFAISLRLNGSDELARARFYAKTYPAATVTTTADLAMGDYVELMALHVEGTGVGLIVGGPYPHLAMELLG